MAIDNSIRAWQERPSTSRLIGPYFPAGLAVSPEEHTAFNFQLFLFDSLKLPRGLFLENVDDQVQFGDLDQC